MTEVRYWPRIGMRVDKETADSFISKLVGAGDVGSILDDSLEEFIAVVPVTPTTLTKEIELLFEAPAEDETPAFDEVNIAILELMDFESKRKSFLLAHKEDGMTMEEAKEAYDVAKANLVRVHLDLDDEEE
jgi:hypothetical protein|tara:strand:+ start:36 stop:428 length:393 start_codon:yes stop_codon:yes gene_type:complete